MKLSFNSNALKTLRVYKKNISEHSKSINNISTGKKINSSKDNPNRISRLGNFEREIRGHQASSRNSQDTISMIQSADSVMGTVNERLNRIRELTVQVGNGSLQESEKNIMQNEIDSLLEGIDYEIKNFSFNDINVLGDKTIKDNSKPGSINALTSGNSGEFTKIPVYNLTTEGLGIDGIDISKMDVDSILEKVDNASKQVINSRTKLGAISNTIEDKVAHSKSLEDVLVGSKSKVEDADVALEMMEFTKTLVLTEANIKNMSKTIYFPSDMINILGKLYK